MNQYEFQAINRKRHNIELIRATAETADIARACIVEYYGSQFEIFESHCNIYAPHQVLGEINCTPTQD